MSEVGQWCNRLPQILAGPVPGSELAGRRGTVHPAAEILPPPCVLVLGVVLVPALAVLELFDRVALFGQDDLFLLVTGWCVFGFVESREALAAVDESSVHTFDAFVHGLSRRICCPRHQC